MRAETKTWCSLPWNHLQVNPGGKIRPCCRYLWPEVPKEFQLDASTSLEDIFHHPHMVHIRDQMLQGKRVAGCQKCYEEEDSGKSRSHRLVSNSQNYLLEDLNIQNPKIEFLELATSNLCNLKCRMCFPFYSTGWYEDHEKLHGKPYEGPRLRKLDLNSLSSSWETLRHIKFTGGEPLMIAEYKRVLEELVSRGRASEVYLNYSTNLTVRPNEDLIELWKKFRYVEFAVSLDGVGEVIEYVRHPSKWSVVDSVLKEILELSYEFDARIGLRSSIMIYNILNLPQILDYWHEVTTAHVNPQSRNIWINPTHVQVPEFLSLPTLPVEKKRLVEQRLTHTPRPRIEESRALRHLLSYMWSQDLSDKWQEFLSFTAKLDQIRGEDFSQLYPELLANPEGVIHVD